MIDVPVRRRELPARKAAPEPAAGRRLPVALALTAIFALAALYHALQSRAHLTPAVFTDELLFQKLAESLASGDGLTVRGEPFLFPAPLAALVQSPAWLLGPVPDGYAAAKALNAVVMSSAAFPAYWLARSLVRPAWALLAAAAAVAAPALVYHSYLVAEPVAYPLFLLALAVMVRELTAPSRLLGPAVPAVCLLAVGTRVQLVVLPIAYLAAVAVSGRIRAHALPAGVLVGLGAAATATGGAVLGPYAGAGSLGLDPLDALHWTGTTAMLVPFAVAWLVVPGAVLGLAAMLRSPRAPAERSFAVLIAAVAAGCLLEAGIVGALEADRALERYAIYLAPLLVIAFLAYAERGAPNRRLYAGIALAAGFLAWLVPFPSLAVESHSFDSPVLSAYGQLAAWLGPANAATILCAGALAGSVALALVRLGPRTAPAFVAASIPVLLALGAVAYESNHRMTERSLRAYAGTPATWLDDSGLGPATYLALPGGSPRFGWTLEAWNRDVERVALLGVEDAFNDSFPTSRAQVRADGTLLVDGAPQQAGVLVVDDWATAIELDGEAAARPRNGLTAYRVPAAPRVSSLTTGLYFDGWAGPELRHQVWDERPSAGGAYRVELELPAGRRARDVTLTVAGGTTRTVSLDPGDRVTVELPAAGFPVPPLGITTPGAELVGAGTPDPRLVSYRVVAIEYRPSGGATPGPIRSP